LTHNEKCQSKVIINLPLKNRPYNDKDKDMTSLTMIAVMKNNEELVNI